MTPTGIIELTARLPREPAVAKQTISINANRIAYWYDSEGGTKIVIDSRTAITVTESYKEVSAAIISAL